VSKKLLERLEGQFGDTILETHSQFGDDTAIVDPKRWVEIATFLREDARCAMDHFIDLTAVDHLNRRTPRYEVVLHVRSIEKLHRIRLKTRIDAEGEANPRIGSLCAVWRGANWFERECFDMFGVEFEGHPDLRRILMYEEFEGHPLRKDYPAQRAQPLIPYREGFEKLPPFDENEGMPWGRQTHDHGHTERNLLGFEEDK
jgi:NADH-quinone oxidoreductase subunit C